MNDSTNPPHVSQHLKHLLLEMCSADQLQHLAAIKRAREPYLAARRHLSESSLEELAEMAVYGKRATCGWWSRHKATQEMETV